MRDKPLSRFATEKGLLQPLPDQLPELAVWTQVKVHRDAHVQFAKSLYSVPYRLIGKTLWLKATPTMVRCCLDHEVVATHPRLKRPGQRSTLRDHLPPDAAAYLMRDPQWCLQQARDIGPACLGVIQALFADRVLDNLRAAQGILRLQKPYGAQRLEAACQRALNFDEPRYRTVKTILSKGLDQSPSTTPTANSGTYTDGGRFVRDTQTLLTH